MELLSEMSDALIASVLASIGPAVYTCVKLIRKVVEKRFGDIKNHYATSVVYVGDGRLVPAHLKKYMARSMSHVTDGMIRAGLILATGEKWVKSPNKRKFLDFILLGVMPDCGRKAGCVGTMPTISVNHVEQLANRTL